MPEFKPKTRAKGSEILNQLLEGELALYEQVGLFTRAITPKSAYRYCHLDCNLKLAFG